MFPRHTSGPGQVKIRTWAMDKIAEEGLSVKVVEMRVGEVYLRNNSPCFSRVGSHGQTL